MKHTATSSLLTVPNIDTSAFLQEKAIKVAPPRTTVDDAGSGDEDWMEGLSVADAIRQFGVDPNVVLASNDILRTPEGWKHEDTSSGTSGSLSSESSNRSESDEDGNTIPFPSKSLTKSRFSDYPSTSDEYTKRESGKAVLFAGKVTCQA